MRTKQQNESTETTCARFARGTAGKKSIKLLAGIVALNSTIFLTPLPCKSEINPPSEQFQLPQELSELKDYYVMV
jgi:hypothetical protein